MGSMASQGEEPVTGLNRYIDDLSADSEIYSTHRIRPLARRQSSPWPGRAPQVASSVAMERGWGSVSPLMPSHVAPCGRFAATLA
jgi:hypothetical protein